MTPWTWWAWPWQELDFYMEIMLLWKVCWLLLRMVLWILKPVIWIISVHGKSEMHNFLPECIYMGCFCTFVVYFQFVGSYEPFLSGSETKENTEVCMSMYFYSQLSSTNWWTCWTIIILYCEIFSITFLNFSCNPYPCFLWFVSDYYTNYIHVLLCTKWSLYHTVILQYNALGMFMH